MKDLMQDKLQNKIWAVLLGKDLGGVEGGDRPESSWPPAAPGSLAEVAPSHPFQSKRHWLHSKGKRDYKHNHHYLEFIEMLTDQNSYLGYLTYN